MHLKKKLTAAWWASQCLTSVDSSQIIKQFTVLFAFCPVVSVNKMFSPLKWLLLFFLFLFVFQYQQLVQHVTLIVDLNIVRNMTLRGGVPFDCFNKTYMYMNIQVMCWLAACSWNSFSGPLILQLFIHSFILKPLLEFVVMMML